MTFVIRCLALADGSPGPRGQFLMRYQERSGFSEWTPDPSKALRFDSMAEAMNFYRQVLPSQPTRPWDGRPNRPLTAFTVDVGELCEDCERDTHPHVT